MRKDLRCFLMLVGVIWALDGIFQVRVSTLPDVWEVYRTVPMPDSDWVIESCGTLGVAGEILARNTRTQQTVTIAEGETFDYKVKPDGPDHVTIELPNWTVLRPVESAFGPFHVDFDYQPKNDPESRAAYQRWYHDKRASENIKWYCENILPTMDKSNQDRWNEILADVYFRFSFRKKYCE